MYVRHTENKRNSGHILQSKEMVAITLSVLISTDFDPVCSPPPHLILSFQVLSPSSIYDGCISQVKCIRPMIHFSYNSQPRSQTA